MNPSDADAARHVIGAPRELVRMRVVAKATLIPTPAHDTQRLQEESLAELAAAQKVSTTIAPGEFVDADQPPALALLDLSVVDGRFFPQLIVEAWEEAIAGSSAPLEGWRAPKWSPQSSGRAQESDCWCETQC